MKTVLCVCTANVCRSPMAEGLLKSMLRDRKDIEILSAGLAVVPDARPSENAVAIMQKEGIDISNHAATPLTEELVQRSTVVLVMTTSHKSEIVRSYPSAKEKVRLLREYDTSVAGQLDIPDPIGLPLEEYQQCYRDIKQAVNGVVETL